jgi:hypothetical protein
LHLLHTLIALVPPAIQVKTILAHEGSYVCLLAFTVEHSNTRDVRVCDGSLAMSVAAEVETVEHQHTRRQRIADSVWKVAAALLVMFLIYVMLHFGSQLIELQGG